jgi:glycine dehydrogenase subunit 2
VVVKKDDTVRARLEAPEVDRQAQAFWGNFGMHVRAYTYIRTMGPDGLRAVSDNAVLNANYIMKRLEKDYDVAARALHARVRALRAAAEEDGVTAMDIAKRLLDLGFYAPSTYFPLIVKRR